MELTVTVLDPTRSTVSSMPAATQLVFTRPMRPRRQRWNTIASFGRRFVHVSGCLFHYLVVHPNWASFCAAWRRNVVDCDDWHLGRTWREWILCAVPQTQAQARSPVSLTKFCMIVWTPFPSQMYQLHGAGSLSGCAKKMPPC